MNEETVTCTYCGAKISSVNRSDGLINGLGFMTKKGLVNVCTDCMIKIGKDKEKTK